MRRIRLAWLAAGIWVLSPCVGFAATINVDWTGAGGAFTTIQEGIDAADVGDEVVIADGTYTYMDAGNVNLDFKGKTITVRSENGPGAVIIDCGNQADTRGVLFDDPAEDNQAVLEGITIRNGSYNFGAGIRIEGGASPTIRNVRLVENNATDSGGGVNVIGSGSNPIFENCVVSGNTAASRGGGIRVITGADATITNCTIDGNTATATASLGGGLYVSNASVTVTGSVISDNTAGTFGGGAAFIGSVATNFAQASIVNTVIYGNSAGNKGGGLRFDSIDAANTLEVINSLLYDNDAVVDGAAVDSYRASPVFYNTTITANLSGVPVVNVHTVGTGTVIPALVSFFNSILWGNSDPVISSQSDLDGDSTLSIDHSNVQNGSSWVAFNSGTGNIDQDPLFEDPAGNDFRLQFNSPAIDAGDNTGVPADNLDLDDDTDTGEAIPYDLDLAARFYDAPNVADTGIGTAPIVDMGAYEAVVMPGTIEFSAAGFDALEGAGTVTITAKRTGGSDGPVSVDYATSDGTADGTDYTPSSGTLNWPDGDMAPKSFTVDLLDDAVHENNETVNLTLSTPTGGALIGSQDTAVLNIIDDEAGIIQFSASGYSVDEDGISIDITVTRTGGDFGDVSVLYTTEDDTALAGSDYTSTNGSLNWADGDMTDKTFSIAITDDAEDESDETIGLRLSNATMGAVLGAISTATVTIEDDELTPAGSGGSSGSGGGSSSGGCFITSVLFD